VRLFALALLGSVLLLHGVPQFLSGHAAIVAWNADEHLLSLALFAFAWAAGERSRRLLDRVFVRLNLTFVVLASLIMLSTAAMEKYQYFRLTQERSANLAEFLRGHVVYYGGQGEDLKQIFNHTEVIQRVVVEFGNLPELRTVDVTYGGERASFSWRSSGEITDYVGPAATAPPPGQARNQFRMIRLPIQGTGAVEFTGTTDLVNERIGKYMIFIYSCFTLVLLMATGVIGMIVYDTDRQLRRQYAELQEAQQQLAQSAKLASIGELAGGMAHEINNPITGILSLASHMSSGKSAERLTSRDRKNLEIIAEQAERIANLVKALLSFSRQTRLHLGTIEVGQLLDTAFDLVRFRLRNTAIRVAREVEPGLPVITGDASRLTEVLVNLLGNAIDALGSEGTLTVRAQRDPDNPNCIRLEVEDSGPGIPAAQLPRIFDPFFTTKPPGKGTGLGLSISHGIVKDHGGQIWARSAPGAGTTIAISLPQEASRYETACVGD
jgi:signal transduction histidine kinase